MTNFNYINFTKFQIFATILLYQITFYSCHYPKENLQFHKNHTFKILQLTDLHYGDSIEQDKNSTIIQEKLINYVNPDLVVITGDTISGYAWDGKDNTFSYRMWRNFSDVFTKTKTKYAYTYGNHDEQGNLSREEIHELELTNNYSYQGRTYDIHGLSNYILPIYSAYNITNSSLNNNTNINIDKDKGKDITALIWMFDTGAYGCMENITKGFGRGYGCIEPDQIDWYKKESDKIRQTANNNIEGLAFFHIDLPEYRDMLNWGYTYGDRYDDMGCPNVNSGAFSEMKRQKNIKATFAGHDHNNDFGGMYQGIELVYGRKTGYGSYGPDYKQRGGRVIELTEYIDSNGKLKFNYEHYIIQEDGTYEFDTKYTRWQGLYRYVWSCSKWPLETEIGFLKPKC